MSKTEITKISARKGEAIIHGSTISVIKNDGSKSVWVDSDKDGKYDKEINIVKSANATAHKSDESKSSPISINNAPIDFSLISKQSLKPLEKEHYLPSEIIGPKTPKDVKVIQKRMIDDIPKAEKNYYRSHLKINGKIEKSEQGKTGDCWALAGVNALSYTKIGAQFIKNSISQNIDGNVTVKLAGAKKSYTFTPAKIKKSSGRLSKGDDDVRVIELAFEAHRKDAYKDKIIKKGHFDSSKSFKIIYPRNILSGGLNAEAIFMLTGKYPSILTNYNNRSTHNKIDYVHQPSQAGKSMTNWASLIKKDSNRYGLQVEKSLSNYLSLIQKYPDRYTAVVSFGHKQKHMRTQHSYSLKNVDKNNVTVVNPWDSAEEIKIPRKAFAENYLELDFFDMLN